MSQTPQALVPLVYLDRDRAGRITREWLPYLTAAANAASNGDLTALQAALDSLTGVVNGAVAGVGTLNAAVSGLSADVAAIDAELAALSKRPGVVMVDMGDDSEDAMSWPIPVGGGGGGGVGPAGPAGPAGAPGVTMFLYDDPPEPDPPIPGARGATGASGGGGGAVTAATLPSVPYDTQYAEVTVADALLTATSKVLIWPGNVMDTDENTPDMGSVEFNAVPSVGSMVVRLSCTDQMDRLGGVYKINYLIG